MNNSKDLFWIRIKDAWTWRNEGENVSQAIVYIKYTSNMSEPQTCVPKRRDLLYDAKNLVRKSWLIEKGTRIIHNNWKTME